MAESHSLQAFQLGERLPELSLNGGLVAHDALDRSALKGVLTGELLPFERKQATETDVLGGDALNRHFLQSSDRLMLRS
jgi:hypothetical protein